MVSVSESLSIEGTLPLPFFCSFQGAAAGYGIATSATNANLKSLTPYYHRVSNITLENSSQT